jgi:hypothetical protein
MKQALRGLFRIPSSHHHSTQESFTMRYGNPSKKTKTIATTKGHAIEFPGRGSVDAKTAPKEYLVSADGVVFVPVPVVIETEVANHGMLPESERDEVDEPDLPNKPEDTALLQTQVFAALDKLVASNDRESFGGNGVPKVAALEKVLGYVVTNAEIKDLWNRYQVDKADKS